jgi:hypothetical protein
MPVTIPYVSPDNGKTVLAAPRDTLNSFHFPCHTFTGHRTRFMAPTGSAGILFHRGEVQLCR